MSEHETLNVIGKPYPKKDAKIKVSGECRFGGDINVPGMLHGKLLRSPYPHAKILSIDTSKAEKLKGVRGVVTGKDFPGIIYGNFAHTRDYLPLAIDRVRFIGEEVAAVAAVDEDTAWEALELIDVEYEPLPTVFDPEEAMKEGAPLLYDDKPGNISCQSVWEFGDMDKGFKASSLIKEDTYRTQAIKHGMLETHVCIGYWDAGGKITLESAKQSPYVVWRQLAMGLGVKPHQVRMKQTFVGAGNSGGKQEAMPMDFAAVMLSKKSGRPVRIVHTMEEVLTIGYMRHPFKMDLKVGVDKQGLIQAVDCYAIADGGAHTSMGQLSIYLLGAFLMCTYKVPNVRYQGYRIYTNKGCAGALRGHCAPQARFAFEGLLDDIADELGLDHFEIRARNAITPGYEGPNGFKITTCGFHEVLDRAKEVSKWDQKKGKLPKYRGIGVGAAGFATGANIMGMSACSALLKVQEDGTVALQSGATDVGQGCDTVLPMIVAEVLGIEPDDVSFALVDSDYTPIDGGTWGSRVTFYAGNAVKAAALDARNQLAQVAAEILKAKEEDLIFKKKKVFVRGNPDQGIELDRLVRHCQNRKGMILLGRGYYNARADTPDHRTGYGNFTPTYSFYAQVCEVEVDPETGQVEILNMWTTHDGGRELNPMLVRGQLFG
ncbi:MAG: xanthine dehydrogenase family protein molybdopterin-binding subunit, partial [Desulfobacterales bacterium]|nr:xanthine dehydrogenase family protein molybdopterin-binding subunit [Desulfobacterales bacterium]